MSNTPEMIHARELAQEIISTLNAKLTADGYNQNPETMDSIALSAIGGAIAMLLAAIVVKRGAGNEYLAAIMAEIHRHVWVEVKQTYGGR